MPTHVRIDALAVPAIVALSYVVYFLHRRARKAEIAAYKYEIELQASRKVAEQRAEIAKEKEAELVLRARRSQSTCASRGDVFLRLSRLLLKDDTTWGVHEIRQFLLEAQRSLMDAQHWLGCEQPVDPPTSRAGYLSSLRELIGKPPTNRTWKGEWESMTKEWLTHCKGYDHWQAAKELQHESLLVQRQKPKFEMEITSLVENMGWEADHAEAWVMLGLRRDVVAKALSERRSDYAAATYAICEALAAAAALQARGSANHNGDSVRREDDDEPSPTPPRRTIQRQSSGLNPEEMARLPPPLYRHLLGKHSLAFSDPKWEEILTPDCNGFLGLTSCALTRASASPQFFTADGFREVIADVNTMAESFKPRDSPIVRFDSMPDDETGMHSALIFHRDAGKRLVSGAFPPNTLFRLREIKEPGEWEIDGCAVNSFDRPAGSSGGMVRPNQKLLIVTATHRPPLDAEGKLQAMSGSKWGPPAITLRYATRDAFIRGHDDILSKPVLTLAQEFDRDIEWEDWKGERYSLRDEWRYVIGTATHKLGCTPGERDANNIGMTPYMFRVRINCKILRRRLRGHGGSLPVQSAYLTEEEVLAVRLYSGPAHQPINDFLRQIAWLTGAYREQLAKHAGVTFTATVRLLCRAIRKLAAITLPWETRKPLFRAVRGELPRAFWVRDEQGLVTAVETAFMSTSSNAATCVNYMQEYAPNVLWQLRPKTETDAGYHRGADISLLSQFCSEAETLFPPCTMLTVSEPEEYPEFRAVNGSTSRGHTPTPSAANGNSRSSSSIPTTGTGRRTRRREELSPPKLRPLRTNALSEDLRKRRVKSRWQKLFSSPELRQGSGKTAPERNYVTVKVLPTFV